MKRLTHFQHLERLVGNLQSKKILDLGSGKGSFLIEAARAGANPIGLELSEAYILETKRRAQQEGVDVEVVKGVAEKLPFENGSFEMINICEVVEHVEDPQALLREVYRVLVPGGSAYISVPNRFGLKDQHFHLYVVNWLPRAWADAFISVFGTHKNYSDKSAGLQRLADMHYYTFARFQSLARSFGFEVEDIRSQRISHEFRGLKKWLLRAAYVLARPLYFDSFHVLLRKR